MSSILKIGDEIIYRGCFGSGTEEKVIVEGITLTEEPREKYGVEVEAVSVSDVRANRTLLSLSNGHWCYGEQVVEV
jgi:hypothetical protein